jgi:hypothetical protein
MQVSSHVMKLAFSIGENTAKIKRSYHRLLLNDIKSYTYQWGINRWLKSIFSVINDANLAQITPSVTSAAPRQRSNAALSHNSECLHSDKKLRIWSSFLGLCCCLVPFPDDQQKLWQVPCFPAFPMLWSAYQRNSRRIDWMLFFYWYGWLYREKEKQEGGVEVGWSAAS